MHIYIYCRVCRQHPPVIGAPRVCCGQALGISFFRLWFGGRATHVTPCSVPRYSYFTMCSEKSVTQVSYKLVVHAAILASSFLFACLRRCFRLNLSNRNKNTTTLSGKKHASKPAHLLLCLLYSFTLSGQC